MSNQSQSDDLQALYDLRLAQLTALTTQLTTLVSSVKPNYSIDGQQVDTTSQIVALNKSIDDAQISLEQIKRLQNIVSPYQFISRAI